MCGIVGILRPGGSVRREEIMRLTAAVGHRGPDDEGTWVHDFVALGHRRLAIIDPERARQPMSDPDGQIWLTYNGELYNFKDLRAELKRLGHRFQTQSDTEVVLNSYLQWGESCVTRFRGMFAFGIVDLHKRCLFLARDHFGIKPLYYRVDGDCLTFASELTALRTLEASPPDGSLQAVDCYLRYAYVPAPLTIYKNVCKLPPAHCVSIQFGDASAQPRRYWHLEKQPALNINDEECTQRFREVFLESVRSHMVSDVPLGVLVSGGVDSCLVAQAMTEIAGAPVNAFSLGFTMDEYSELEYAHITADKLGLDLTVDIVGEDLFGILPELTRHCGEPFGDSSIMPTWYLSKMAREQVPLVLSGDGGDEAFAGYTTYQSWLDSLLKNPAVPGCPREMLARWEHFVGYYALDERRRLWKKSVQDTLDLEGGAFEYLTYPSDRSDTLWLAQNTDYQTYLPGDILYKMDMASMYHGLEVRTPFTDIKVAEFAASLKPGQRLQRESGKWLSKPTLRATLGKQFPDSFVHRPKKGFSIPRKEWLSPGAGHRQRAEEIICDCEPIKEWFAPDQLQRSIEQPRNNRGQLWLLIVLALWLDANPEIRFA